MPMDPMDREPGYYADEYRYPKSSLEAEVTVKAG